MATKTQMTEKEKKDWDDVYQYFKKEIMGYDENQSLDRSTTLRLKGLKTGQYIANHKHTALANYPYPIILLTLKYVKPRLDDLFKVTKFNDEQHKVNYVLKIVEANINNVYNKAKQIKEEQTKAVEVKVYDLPNYTNKYENKKVDKKLEEFW